MADRAEPTARIILAGDLEEGERRVLTGFELGQATGRLDAATYMAVQLFHVRLEQDRLAELEKSLTERVTALRRLPALRACLARLLCELGRPDDALEHYEPLAATNFTALPWDTAWTLGMGHCAAVSAHLGGRPRARILFDLLPPYAIQYIFTSAGSLNAVTHHLAVLATTYGDFDEAERCFAEAAATHERIPAPIWVARTQLEWAGCSSPAAIPATATGPVISCADAWTPPATTTWRTSSGAPLNF